MSHISFGSKDVDHDKNIITKEFDRLSSHQREDVILYAKERNVDYLTLIARQMGTEVVHESVQGYMHKLWNIEPYMWGDKCGCIYVNDPNSMNQKAYVKIPFHRLFIYESGNPDWQNEEIYRFENKNKEVIALGKSHGWVGSIEFMMRSHTKSYDLGKHIQVNVTFE